MDWTAVSASGELIGAAAVVLSLVYVSRQIQQNTRALRTANAATVQQNFQMIARAFITDREAAGIVIRALQGGPVAHPAGEALCLRVVLRRSEEWRTRIPPVLAG